MIKLLVLYEVVFIKLKLFLKLKFLFYVFIKFRLDCIVFLLWFGKGLYYVNLDFFDYFVLFDNEYCSYLEDCGCFV